MTAERNRSLEKGRNIRGLASAGTACLVALALLLQVGCAAKSTSHGGQGPTAAEFEQRIGQALHKGSSLEETLAFLDEQGTVHGGRPTQDRRLYAVVRGVKKTLLTTTNLQATFTFGEDEKLQSYVVEEFRTVP